LQTLSSTVSHVLLQVADTLINWVSFLFPDCRHSHQLCLISCSILQTLSSIVSHFMFHIADTLINCVSFLVPDCIHSHQLCLVSCSGLQTLSSICLMFFLDCRHSNRQLPCLVTNCRRELLSLTGLVPNFRQHKLPASFPSMRIYNAYRV
jgi:hypothetical protein